MSGYYEGVLVLLAINIVFAYGAYLPLAAGQLNLGIGGFAAVGAYSSAYFSGTFAIHPFAAIPLGGAIAGIIALGVAVPVLRTRGIYLALATFAVGQIVKAAILNMEFLGGAAGYPVAAFVRLPVVLIFAFIITVLVLMLFATRFGVALRAIQDDELVADLMGVEVREHQIAAFVLGAVIVGIGGGLYAHHFSYIEAQYFNVGLSINIVLYVLLGGTQTAWGPLAGAVLFTLLPEFLRSGASLRYVIFAASVIVLMALRPQGLLTRGNLARLLDWRRPLVNSDSVPPVGRAA
jgi:branched-chain amino acid transport system permease protein